MHLRISCTGHIASWAKAFMVIPACILLLANCSNYTLTQSLAPSELKSIEKAFGKSDAPMNKEFGINAYVQASEKSLSDVAVLMTANKFSEAWQALPSGMAFTDLVKNYNEDSKPNELFVPYQRVLELSDYMKNEFLLDVSIKIPDSVGGDND